MLPATKKDKIRLAAAICMLVLLGSGLIWFGRTGQLGRYSREWWDVFKNTEQIRDYLNSWGGLAPLAFVAIQALQVVVSPIPGEVTGLVGGFLFGTLRGLMYSTIGLTLGSTMAFLAARVIGQPFVNLIISRETFEKFKRLTGPQRAAIIFVLFVIPGFPKDILSYLLGLSPMRLLTFIIVCGLGRVPGTVLLSFTGSAFYAESWDFLAIISLITIALVVLFYLKRDAVKRWIEKVHIHKPET
ncbi:MAG TPA: TVP38/TMEM64 family protein [Desulfomonilaceae bacterium]|nr:TVP38/TMEM64 family protein [Desulfomonilaceae bacterium]